MGTIAEFNIPADDFALGPTFQELPNLRWRSNDSSLTITTGSCPSPG
ncbi:hypothetical protein [Halalkalicoccus salilacus]